MAWQACSSDIFLRSPLINFDQYAQMSIVTAYRLFADDSDVDNVKIRIDISYVHMSVQSSDMPAVGYWNAIALSWFLGNTRMIDQDQLALNNDRDEDGNYLHPFAWPYLEGTTGSYESAANAPFTWNLCVQDVNSVMYNNLPIIAFSFRDDVNSFTSETFSYGYDANNLSSSARVISWGSVYRDTSLFNGSNANGQSKIQKTNHRIDVSSSALRQKSTGNLVRYEDELNIPVSDLEVVNPYYDGKAIATIEIDEQTLDSLGLLKYDPQRFETDGVSDPYVIQAYVVPTSIWTRYRMANEFSNLARAVNSQMEVTLEYEQFEIPEYKPPEPIEPVDDNMVFRLKKQYTDGGQVIVDQNGNPILAWVKCERMGQE